MSATEPITSPQSMIARIRQLGIVPLFRSAIPGWSIDEMTAPEFRAFSSDELGPWDWKIDAMLEGDIVYGKFIGRKVALATIECYRHLMNWRRSLPQYRLAVGDDNYNCRTIDDRMMRLLAPILLQAVRQRESLDSSEIKTVLTEHVTQDDLRQIGGHVVKYLVPSIKHQAVSFVTQFLEMGTWTVVGGFERLYRGKNLEYNGWQRSFITTPEALFGLDYDAPAAQCTPQQSRSIIAQHIAAASGCNDTTKILKLI